ncbi:hypothetical protein AHAS_Ahas15G0138400 [Arachis hypogaea]
MGFLSSPLIFKNNNKHPDNLIVIPKKNYSQFTPFDCATLPPKHLLITVHLPPTPPRSCPNRNLQQHLKHVCIGDPLFAINPHRWQRRDRTVVPPCQRELLGPGAALVRPWRKHHRCTFCSCVSVPCFAN